MTFTDEDLGRLKIDAEAGDYHLAWERQKLQALLHRLSCAEELRYCECAHEEPCHCGRIEAWRTASGKTDPGIGGK